MVPRLAIVVCTFDRAAILDRCLASLRAQDAAPADFEVVVVDNGSTDCTRDVVISHISGISTWRYVLEPAQGLSHARNRGAREAAAPYVTYIDDDAVAPPSFVRTVLGVLDSHAPDILGGPILPYYTSPKPRWFRDEYESRRYADASGFSTTCGVSGSNFTIRRELVQQLGGFDAALGMNGGKQGLGEDRALLLAYRQHLSVAQQRVYYSIDCPILHWVPPHKFTLSYMLRRQFQGGLMNVCIANRAATTADTVVEIGRAPWASIRYVVRQWRRNGVLGTDYRQILLFASFHAGIFTAILCRLPSRLRSRRRQPVSVS